MLSSITKLRLEKKIIGLPVFIKKNTKHNILNVYNIRNKYKLDSKTSLGSVKS